MNVQATELPGVVLIEPDVFGDPRGYFMEIWSEIKYRELGLPERFVQDNISLSARGVLRGLHYQHPRGQGKLVYVLQGEVFDVVVDIRQGSPTFGKWAGAMLSAENKRQMYIPPGFAHGFCVLSEQALFAYKCTEFYCPQQEGAVRWDDPDIAIAWPLQAVSLSKKDAVAPRLVDIEPQRLPTFDAGDTVYLP